MVPLVAPQSNVLNSFKTLNINRNLQQHQPVSNVANNNQYVVVMQPTPVDYPTPSSVNPLMPLQRGLIGHLIFPPRSQPPVRLDSQTNLIGQVNQTSTQPTMTVNYSAPSNPSQNTDLHTVDIKQAYSSPSTISTTSTEATVPLNYRSLDFVPNTLSHKKDTAQTPSSHGTTSILKRYPGTSTNSIEEQHTISNVWIKKETVSTDDDTKDGGSCTPNVQELPIGYKNPFDYSSYKLKCCSSKTENGNEGKEGTYKIPKVWGCTICYEKTDDKNSLIEHYKRYHSEQKHEVELKCDQCEEHFPDAQTLFKHSFIHEAREACLCYVCGRTFAGKPNFDVHLRTHVGVKKFQCNTCGEMFLRRCTLVTHIRTHTGEKPYKCSTCGKGFAQRTPLVVHQRGHTGERPYKCSRCKKGFVSKNALDIHAKSCRR